MDIDVFVSYARGDRKFADVLVSALNNAGLKVWWDARLLPGDAFAVQIGKALEASRIVLGLLSPMSLRSRWVIEELTYAHRTGIVIVPVCVGGALPGDLPSPLNTIQALVLDELRPEVSATEIAREINALLGSIGERAGSGTEEARRRLASAAVECAGFPMSDTD